MWTVKEDNKPNIDGELPVNEQELADYLAFMRNGLSKLEYFIVGDELLDIFRTPIRVEIVTDGLKATSAGPDKEFNTEDDIVFIRTYESVGMEPLN